MKFRITAIDGTDFVLNHKPDDGWGLKSWEPGCFGNLISTDGVNKAMPMDPEAFDLVRKIRDAEFAEPEWTTIDAGPPDENPGWEAERGGGGGGYPSAEGALYDRLESEAPEAFSNGDGTGQVDLRLLPSGW